ncbi:GTPase IMAP family member 4-like [Montipora foliosa]|uniref:GTPase IMAP family member 4-like n=1 Tax=Montipora foliosa TaxID=591990 RepID=UPI0035F19466
MAETQAVKNRNVVVLGKTGAGKSTVANKISGLQEFEVKNVAGSVTSEVKSVCCIFSDNDNRILYHLKTIDTIGVFDTKRKNDDVMAEIKKFFLTEAPEGVNLVLFVFRRGRFTEEEIRTFEFITKNFKEQISGFSAMVITACEGLNEQARAEFLYSFRQEAGDIASFMKKGIYTVGFPDVSNMTPRVRMALEEDIKDEIQMLRRIVMDADQRCLGKEMFRPGFWEKLRQCVIL